MSTNAIANAQRFAQADDDCTAVIDKDFSTATAPRLTKVLCRAIDQADAAFIIRTLNAHASLINALTLLTERMESDTLMWFGFQDELKHARAALAAAGAA